MRLLSFHRSIQLRGDKVLIERYDTVQLWLPVHPIPSCDFPLQTISAPLLAPDRLEKSIDSRPKGRQVTSIRTR